MTPHDIIALALKDAGITGVGQAMSAEDANDAFTRLNLMLGQWNARRWTVFHLLDVSKVATGAASYTIGVGGDFNTPRIDRIEDAYIRSLSQSAPNQVDYPLRVIQAREEWDRIPMKGVSGFPSVAFLDSNFPTGTLYVSPIPFSGQFEIHLLVKAPIAQFTNLNQAISLPPEYSEALLYNLTARLMISYGRPVRQDIVALARVALNTLQNANLQIPQITMPVTLRRPRFNIYSGDYVG